MQPGFILAVVIGQEVEQDAASNTVKFNNVSVRQNDISRASHHRAIHLHLISNKTDAHADVQAGREAEPSLDNVKHQLGQRSTFINVALELERFRKGQQTLDYTDEGQLPPTTPEEAEGWRPQKAGKNKPNISLQVPNTSLSGVRLSQSPRLCSWMQ